MGTACCATLKKNQATSALENNSKKPENNAEHARQARSALENNSKKPQNNAEHARLPQSSQPPKHHSKSIQAFCATKYVAIIIAMKNYEKKRSIPGSEDVQDIPEVIDDMKNIKKGLQGLGGCNFDIRTFENASLKELQQLHRDLIAELTTNEKQGERTCLFFYYAGHGMQDNYTFAVLNEERNYPMEKNLRILANTPRAYVVALFDCCRTKIRIPIRGSYADQSIPEDEEGQNLVITFGCPPSDGTPVKSTIATAYFERLREGAEQDGSVLVPQALIGWRGTDGKCETLPLIKQPLKLMIHDNAQINNISVKAQEVRDKIGEFSYDDHEYESQLGQREKRQMVILEDGAQYEGEWLLGTQIRQGQGKQIWPDGSIYEGYWADNKRNGKGRLIHADGREYKGYWVNDKKEGHGVYQWPNGDRYEGNFIGDKQEGHGVYQWQVGDRYEGNFIGDKQEGHGVYQWPDGVRYEGDWVNDNMEGHGVHQWPDGRRYEGQFENNQKHGVGTYTNVEGKARKGQWSEGELTAWL